MKKRIQRERLGEGEGTESISDKDNRVQYMKEHGGCKK